MRSPPRESIVLTGCGWVTPFAAGTIGDVLEAANAAQPGPPPSTGYWAVPDDLPDECPGLARELSSDRGAWLAAVALERARRQAALQPDSLEAERVGMALGCGLAGQLGMINFAIEVREQSPRFVSPIHFPQTVGNYVAGALARGFDIRGPNVTLASGSASGLDAIVEGCDFIASGRADVVFAGGFDPLSGKLARALAEPGVVLSEGACLFVLEPAHRAAERGAPWLAMIARPAHLVCDRKALPPASEAILSAAACRHPGAILIEHWVGRCPGACGAAAVAAAIGAAHEHEVPVVDSSDPTKVAVGRVPLDPLPLTDATVPAVVFTGTDGPHHKTFEICIPRR